MFFEIADLFRGHTAKFTYSAEIVSQKVNDHCIFCTVLERSSCRNAASSSGSLPRGRVPFIGEVVMRRSPKVDRKKRSGEPEMTVELPRAKNAAKGAGWRLRSRLKTVCGDVASGKRHVIRCVKLA